MLSINNRPLPAPAELELSLKEKEAGGYLSLLCLRARWPGLSAGEMREILRDTAQSFTLGCPDPRAGQERGVTSRLAACRARALGGGLYSLELWTEEME